MKVKRKLIQPLESQIQFFTSYDYNIDEVADENPDEEQFDELEFLKNKLEYIEEIIEEIEDIILDLQS